MYAEPTTDDPLRKREDFAVALRASKKLNILREKREQMELAIEDNYRRAQCTDCCSPPVPTLKEDQHLPLPVAD